MKKIAAIIISAAMLVLCSCSVSIGYVYPNGDKYSAGDATIDEKISVLDISWSSGAVTVKYHDGDTVEVSEACTNELPERKKLHWLCDDGALYVKYSASGESVVNAKKELTVLLPQGTVLEKLNISTASANVNADLISAKAAKLDTASGDIIAKLSSAERCELDTASGKIDAALDGEVKKLEADSSSGAIRLFVSKVNELDVETASGKINVTAVEALDNASFESASGSIDLYLPKDAQFIAEVDTASGEFECEIPTVRKGDQYISGDGSTELEFDTASGDISILKSGEK